MNISDFKESDVIKGTYLVGNVVKGKTNSGSDYLSINLQDSTGDIVAKLWQVSAEQKEMIKNGTFLYVEANVISYRDALQLKINKVQLVDLKDVNVDSFVKKAPREIQDLRNELQQFIYLIDDGIINTIVTKMIKKYEDKLLDYPAAAKIHHAYHGGLMYHIVSMLKLGKALIELYPNLNKNYLYAGIILHDIGKLEELSGVVATEYTTKGKLVGHISIVNSEIESIAKEIGEENSEQVMVLEHLVLSHHGKYDYGSPVLPMIREAEILTYIDNIDARMDTLNNVFENVEPGTFSPRVFALDNRSFYLPTQGGMNTDEK